MADSFVQVPPDSTGKQIATNEVGGKQYRVVNLADDAGNAVSPLTNSQLRASAGQYLWIARRCQRNASAHFISDSKT